MFQPKSRRAEADKSALEMVSQRDEEKVVEEWEEVDRTIRRSRRKVRSARIEEKECRTNNRIEVVDSCEH